MTRAKRLHHQALAGQQGQAFAAAQKMIAGTRAAAPVGVVKRGPHPPVGDAQHPGVPGLQAQRSARAQLPATGQPCQPFDRAATGISGLQQREVG